MPKKIICNIPREELYKLYITENRTLKDMCDILGIKSPITMSKILHEKGIDTNKNKIISNKTMMGMSHIDFKNFLIEEYKTKGIAEISKNLGVTRNAIRKYFKKYGITFINRRSEFCSGENNANWKGGKHMHNGYIEVYSPQHPRKNKRNCVYEHDLIMEQHIGRLLEPNEVVHHKDFNKTNNDISNLVLMTNKEHAKYHSKTYWNNKKGSGEWIC